MKKTFCPIIILGIILLSFGLNAQTWSAFKRLTWNSGDSAAPSIASDSTNRIHLAWYDKTPGNYEIYFKRSTNGGANWSAPKRLSWNSGGSYYPSIAADSSNGIHVAWYDLSPGNMEIFYKRSTDGGANWSGLKRLTWTSSGSVYPALAADSGTGLHLVWYNSASTSSEIYYKCSTDSGATWSGPKRLTWNAGSSIQPAITPDSGNGIHVVWDDHTPGNGEIFYKQSTDSGTTWSGSTRLTWNTGDSNTPYIATGSGNSIHVIWEDNTPGNYEIFYKNSTDSGTTWSAPKRLTWNSGYSAVPSLVIVSGNKVHAVWSDDTPGNNDIFYKRSSDGGTTWSGPKRQTWNVGSSYFPAITSDSGDDLHLVWNDKTPGNKEIFYKNRK